MGASSSMDGPREEGVEPRGQNTDDASIVPVSNIATTVLRRRPPPSGDFSVLESMLQDQSATPICLPMDFLTAITSDFSEERELGRGGFGVVYKGVLRNGKTIAVKKLSEITNLDDDQFQKEVTNLFGLKHKNIVQLLGYCAESRWEATETGGRYVMAEVRKRLICFEYINNKSLDKHLPAESHGLDWHMGFEIIKGICHGLHYLHTECQIVHLDIKPQNILLDENMEPKIADFGMSRLFGPQQSRIITQSRGGTCGYMSPEYIDNGLISIKADIFSLGVIIIELMSGDRDYPTTEESHEHFIDNVVRSWRKRMVEAGRYTPLEKYVEQVKTCTLIALMCVHAEPNKRPTARDIVAKLLTDADVSTTYVGGQGSGDPSELDNNNPKNRPLLQRFRRLLKNSLFTGSRTSTLTSQPKREPQLVHFDDSIPFAIEDLLRAEAEVLGKGTYGTVYKAELDNGTILAVKRIRQEMIKDHREVKAEMAVLGKVRHPNLLGLRAYHLGPDEFFVVYDYMPNGSLFDLLHARARNTRVDWATRMAMAKGAARGLAYLHFDMGIIHGNLTARNVLLDQQSQPKIADFGFSFGVMTSASSSNMLAVARDRGYRAPELFASVMKANTKTDVYSLGTIILELLTGKSPSDIDVGLPRWVASVSREEWTSEVFDVELLRKRPSGDELEGTMTLALQCVDASPSVRPQAREVLLELERIRPGPENATGQSQHSSPPVQLEAREELEQVRSSPEDVGSETSDENYSPLRMRSRAIHIIEVAEQLRRPGFEAAEQPEQVRLPLEDIAGTSENHSRSTRNRAIYDIEVAEQLRRPRPVLVEQQEVRSSPEDGTGISENHSPTPRNRAIYTDVAQQLRIPRIETAEQPEQILLPLEDNSGTSDNHSSSAVRKRKRALLYDIEVPDYESTEQPELVRSPQEDGTGTSDENHSSWARNRAIHTIVVSEQLRRPVSEPAEETEQEQSSLEDGAGLSEHQPPLVTTDDQDVVEHIIWSGQEDALDPDALEQLRQIVSTPEEEDDTVASEDEKPVVPIETQADVLEQLSSTSEDGTRSSNPLSSSMQPENRDELQLQLLDENIRSGHDDDARPTADQLPSTQPEEREVLEVDQGRPGPEAGDETSQDLSSVQEQREAQEAEQEQLEVGDTGPEGGTAPSDEPPPSLRPEDPEVSQREHVQPEPEADDVSGRNEEGNAAHAHARPVIFSFFIVCFPFLVRE